MKLYCIDIQRITYMSYNIFQIFARNALRSYVYIIGEKLPNRLLFSEIQLQS